MTSIALLSAGLVMLLAADNPSVHTVTLPVVDKGFRTEPGPLAVSPDGKLVATLTGPTVSVWDMGTGKPVTRAHVVVPDDSTKFEFSADSRMLVYAGSRDKAVRWFDLRTGKQAKEWAYPPPKDAAHSTTAQFNPAFALGPGAGWLLGGEWDADGGILRARDLDTGRHRSEFRMYWLNHTKSLVTRDKKLVAPGREWQLNGIDVWDVAAGKLLHTLPDLGLFGKGQRRSLGASADGRYLAVFEGNPQPPRGSDYFISVWGLHDGRLRCYINTANYPVAAAFSADGWGLLVGTSMGVTLIDLRTEATVSGFSFPDRRSYRPASPDGKALAIIATSTGTGSIPDSLHLTVFPDLPPPLPPTGDLTARQVSDWWAALGSPNEFRRRYAIQAFVARPEQAVAEVAARVKPEPATRRAMVADLIGVLNDDQYETRDKVQAELQPLARRFEPLLTATAEKAGPGEVRNRITTLLAPRMSLTSDDLQADLGAVAVLELVDSTGARNQLTKLAGGAADSRLTNEAKAALDRLNNGGR